MPYSFSGSTLTATGAVNLADALAADITGGWGVFAASSNSNYYEVTTGKTISVGNGSTATTWTDSGKFWNFIGTATLLMTANATLNIGTVTANGGTIRWDNSNMLLNAGTVTIRNCLLTGNSGSGYIRFGSSATITNSLFIGMYNVSVTAGTYSDCSFINNYGGIVPITTFPTFVRCFIDRSASTAFRSGVLGTLTGMTFGANNLYDYELTGPGTLNCKNTNINHAKFFPYYTSTHILAIQRSFDVFVGNKLGTGLQDVLVTCTAGGVAAFSVNTAASGNIVQQTVTVGLKAQFAYTDRSAIVITLTKAGYITQSFNLFTSANNNGEVLKYYMKEVGDEADPTFNDATLTVANVGDGSMQLTIPNATSNCGVTGIAYRLYMKAGSAPTVGQTDYLDTISGTQPIIRRTPTGTALVPATVYYFKVVAVDQVGNTTGGVTTVNVTYSLTPPSYVDSSILSQVDVRLRIQSGTGTSTYFSPVKYPVWIRKDEAPTQEDVYLLGYFYDNDMYTCLDADGAPLEDGTYHIKVGCVDKVGNITGGIIDNEIVFVGDIPVVTLPVISSVAKGLNSSVDITLTCDTTGASIYYTLDGSAPSAASTLYTATFSIASSLTVKAIGIKAGSTNSGVATSIFNVALTPVVGSPLIDAILDNLVDTFGVISTSANYNYNVGLSTRDGARDWTNLKPKEMPCAFPYLIQERDQSLGASGQTVLAEAMIKVRGVVQATTGIETVASKWLQDMERIVNVDKTRGGFAITTYVEGKDIYDTEKTNVKIMDLLLKIVYQYKAGEPNVA